MPSWLLLALGNNMTHPRTCRWPVTASFGPLRSFLARDTGVLKSDEPYDIFVAWRATLKGPPRFATTFQDLFIAPSAFQGFQSKIFPLPLEQSRDSKEVQGPRKRSLGGGDPDHPSEIFSLSLHIPGIPKPQEKILRVMPITPPRNLFLVPSASLNKDLG